MIEHVLSYSLTYARKQE